MGKTVISASSAIVKTTFDKKENETVELPVPPATSLFDYELPESAIAQVPAQQREKARLLVVDRAAGRWEHHVFDELPDLLPAGWSLFRNNARVLKARLPGWRKGGGAMECMLLHPAATEGEWWCLLRPGRRLPPGSTFALPGKNEGQVLEKTATGEYRVTFRLSSADSVWELAEQVGRLPLPPYIQRPAGQLPADEDRYQTVYAAREKTVAVAAPTAGLHFTSELFDRLAERGCPAYDLTLHVGLGTFRPIAVENLAHHRMHEEWYEIGPDTRRRLRETSPGTRLAIGTTTLRALEDYFRQGGAAETEGGTWARSASLFLYPPCTFQVGALLTNFHLPRSTLLCLVSAFLTPGRLEGIAWLKELYREALDRGYRFYSYGDAMLLR